MQIGDIGGAPVIPLSMLLIGGYLAWFGVKYWRSDVTWPSDPVKAVLQGKQLPASHPVDTSASILAQQLNNAGGGWQAITGAGASPTGQAIANDADQYQGAGYVWGGIPARGIGNWDCSSFSNEVIGHDMHMSIPGFPGGSYTGDVHGPSTLEWISWTGCRTVGRSGADAVAGDLCVWQTHMGIAIGPNQMISAQSPSTGTQVSEIDGFIPSEQLFIRRLNATAVSTGSGGGRKK